MALASMTGFARTAFEAEGAKYSWELKSVNARGLEVRLRLAAGLEHIEADARAQLRERVGRGSCFLTLAREAESEQRRVVLNEAALALVVAAARKLATVEGIAAPTADGLLAIPGVLEDGDVSLKGEAAERRDAAVLKALAQTIDHLLAARVEEGRRLGVTLDDQVAAVERLVGQARGIAAEAPEALKARIREQVALLTADGASLNPDRLHQEALLAATRADVREELDRLTSHVESARGLLASGGAVGRRLDFLSQEFNREANTLCSKAFDRRLTTIGLELKAVIDQFREQVQNLA
jgi:uncharacterized protein (TIGR00255 family)